MDRRANKALVMILTVLLSISMLAVAGGRANPSPRRAAAGKSRRPYRHSMGTNPRHNLSSASHDKVA
jgi:hypothetical protein